MIDYKQISLIDTIPSNLLKDEKVQKLAEIIEKQNLKFANVAEKLNYNNLYNLPEEVIDHLLWEKNIGYKEGLMLAKTIEDKIALLESAIYLHRLKGTPAALEEVFNKLNKKAHIQEWFEYDGDPYHFRIDVNILNGMTEEEIQLMDILIDTFKNTRSELESITFNVPIDNNAIEASVIVESETMLVYPEIIESFIGNEQSKQVITVIEAETTTVYPVRSDI